MEHVILPKRADLIGAAVGLTDAKIAGLKPPEKGQAEYADQVVRGLRIRIGASGVKTFILRKRASGKAINLTLGRYHPRRFNLAHARRKARDAILDIEGGKPPPKPARNALKGSVRAMVEEYLANEVRAKKRSAGEIERVFRVDILPAIGDRLADSITRADVTRLVDGVVNANGEKPRRMMGRKVHAFLSAFYSWALPGLEGLPGNPCRDARRPAPSKARERVLSDAEIKAFWETALELGWPFGDAFRLLLATAARRSEVLGAYRAEFDLREKAWTIPAERAKNGIEHVVPLSPLALRIVENLPVVDGSPRLFPAHGASQNAASGVSKLTARLRQKMAARPGVDQVEHFTLHDLRRTAATGMQRLGVALPVVEAVLNHVSGSRAGVAGVYQRHHYTDEKRHALNAWAAEIERIVAGRKRGNVVPLKGRAK